MNINYELIARMLADYMWPDKIAGRAYRVEAIQEQIDALNAADNADAAGVRTVNTAGPVRALAGVAEKLRRAGASLPAQEVKGTPESGVTTGLSIALALVEAALASAPPSATVGVEELLADLERIWHSVSDDKETNAAYERLKIALAQQPEAPAQEAVAVEFTNPGDSEAQFIADSEALNCPSCGGSGHAGDAQQPATEAVRMNQAAGGEAVAWMRPEDIAHLARKNGPAKVDAWNCASGSERVPVYTAPPAAQVQQWQPIETAPRDELVLVYDYRKNQFTVGGVYKFTYATHWMPLPAAP